MTESAKKQLHSIVVGVDYSELGDLALERAFEFAKAQPDTHLDVVHVETSTARSAAGYDGESLTPDLGDLAKHLNQYVERVLKRWREGNDAEVGFARLTTHVRSGSAAEAIAQLASDVEAELVIVGTHGRRGARRFLLGSVAENTVRLAPCAVLVVRQPDASIPAIEPPCPRCLEARRASGGKEFWCEQHGEQHERRHTHHYSGGSGGRQSGFLIHTHR